LHPLRRAAYNHPVDATGSGGGKPKGKSARAEHEAALRSLYHRRRAITFTAILIILTLGWIAYSELCSGHLVLYQQADADSITRGFSFGPFYAPARRHCRYAYSVRIPASSGLWETRVEIQNAHGATIYPQTDLITAGKSAFGESARLSRSCRFVMRDAGFYYLKFTQVNGAYGSTLAPAGTPVMALWVRADVVGGMMEWLPVIIVGVLILLLWFLI
jgi:hypothetical protein